MSQRKSVPNPSRTGRSPSLWASVSALALGAAILAPQAASAANYAVSTEAELQAAILAANASADANSTIQLTQAIVLADPSALPVSTKPIVIIDTNGFTLDNLVLNGAPQVNLVGGGQANFSTTTPSNFGLLLVSDGETRILAGAHVTTTNLTNITGNGTLIVDGGRLDATQFTNTAVAGTATVQVVHGGVIDASTGTIWANGSNLNLTVADSGSRLHVAGTTSLGGSLATVTVSNGGTLAFDSRFVTGTPGGVSQHSVTIKDAGSGLTVGADLGVVRGTLDVLAGAQVTAGSITMGGGAVNQSPTMTVSGGSVVDVTGAVRMGQVLGGANNLNTLILNTGGALNAGGLVTVGFNATKTGNLVIGGVGAAQAAGDLSAAGVALTTGSGTLTFNHTDTNYIFATPISGGGVINHVAGATHLTGDSSTFTGATHVTGGTLYVDGKLGDATATLDIQAGGVLGGSGTFGGTVTSVGGTIAPGDSPGTLTIGGDLILDAASTLNVEFGQSGVVGGPLNDLVAVNGDLTLDGTVNVTQTAGGVFDVGLYRIASYGGALHDQGLALGAMPGGATVSLQTAITGQVNLVNTTGLPVNFWDGDGAGSSGNNLVDGGSGTWTVASSNWTFQNGAVNTGYTANSFLIFAGASGTVTSSGSINVGGMQFAADGYHLQGGGIGLGAGPTTIRVGDGTAAGAAYVATVSNTLRGPAKLVKTDLGTLVLTGGSNYAGGTQVSAGTLLINGNQSGQTAANLVDATGTLGGIGRLGGTLTVNGTLAPGDRTAPGMLTINGDVILAAGSRLNYRLGDASSVGGALNDLLTVNGDLTLDGTLNVTETAGGSFGVGIYRLIDYTGTLTNNTLNVGSLPGGGAAGVQTAIAHQVNLINSGSATLSFWDGDGAGAENNSAIDGGGGTWTATSGNWTSATGALNATYSTGDTVIFAGAAGTVNVGTVNVSGAQFAVDGYHLTGGSIALGASGAAFRVGDGTTAGANYVTVIDTPLVSGGGTSGLTKTDLGTLILTGASTYSYLTTVQAGTLLMNGSDRGGTANGTIVSAAGTLGGTGSIRGGVIAGTLAPGDLTDPGTLTITGNLGLNSTATLRYRFGQAGVAGGSLNDLLVVNGNLTLNGTLNVATPAGGTFGAGIYRLINYGGVLTDNVLDIGSLPNGAAGTIQTAIAHQVNLVTTAGEAVNFWDGDAPGTADNGVIEGGAGTWTAASGNWTVANGAANGTYSPGDLVVFAGTGGAVSASNVDGALSVGGMQFAVDGYALSGDEIGLGNLPSDIRVGDGTAAGAAYVAAIDNVLGGIGGLRKTDLGTLVLTGANTYAGGTQVAGGLLLVNGDQSAQTAANLVEAAGALGGTGRLGGDLTVLGTLAPGGLTAPGAFTVDGDLTLAATARLRYRLGAAGTAGGPLNDLLTVDGDLTLDGALDVAQSAGGTFGAGVYRLIDYTGVLTNNGLNLGSTPGGALSIQTAIAHQVNLVNATGLPMNFWDGDALGTAGDNLIQGGSGTWTAASTNWTDANGAGTWAYTPDDFVIFTGSAGTVTASGPLSVSGMQFAVGGYHLTGGEIGLGSGAATMRVGDGTAVGAAHVATIDNVLSGAAALRKTDFGTLVLNGASTYAGGTQVLGGVLLVNGDQSAQTAANTVGAAGTLGGTGRLGGDLTVNGTLSPGGLGAAGALTIDGSLMLTSTARLDYQLGAAGVVGGPLNDLLVVNGDLTLDGELDVAQSAGGTFGAGVYRLIDYTGALDDQGLVLGSIPGGAMVSLQTAIAHQVNLVNTTGLSVSFWDGDGAGTSGNNAIDGGAGTWTATSTNWTLASGAANSAYAPGDFMVFAGAPGAVNASDANGAIDVAGLQFAVGGYHLAGDAIGLDAGSATVRVGDGTAAGSAYVATIDNVLGGAGRLVKTDLGTLVLTGSNTYAGGTQVSGGLLLVNGDQSARTAANLVDTAGKLGGVGRLGGDLTVNGTLSPGEAGAAGALTIDGDLTLTAGAKLDYQLGAAGAAGGPLNDLLVVNGDLTLDGVLDVSQSAGGVFGQGVYRLIDYTGALNDNGLDLGTLATSLNSAVQTSVANQVNLVVTTPVTPPTPVLNFWDGDHGTAADGRITGGEGTWTAGAANWTSSNGLTNGAYADDVFVIFAGTGGRVTVDSSAQPIGVSGMQFAADGYSLDGGAVTLAAGNNTVRVGDGTAAGAAFTATIASQLTGAGRLDKTDGGTLVLTGANTYAGGTRISGGTLQLGAGGTTGSIVGDVSNDGVLVFNRSDTITFGGAISGAGMIEHVGSGVTTLMADNSTFIGQTRVQAGTLAVDGRLGGTVSVLSGGRLSGVGTVGALANAGVVAPGHSIGVLTVGGDYVGLGGTLEMEAELDGDASAADRLVVRGATSGSTLVDIKRLGGGGAPTPNGILLVQVDGASNGVFTLAHPDYKLSGEDVLVAGAYGYALRKDAANGDWSLRSSLIPTEDPTEPGGGDPTTPPPTDTPDEPEQPLYQPGAPIYEAYPQTLQLLNGLGALRQRTGSRQWSGQAVWGRVEGGHSHLEPGTTSTQAGLKADRWKMEFGTDHSLSDAAMGGQLTGGITAHYGEVRAKVASPYGGGRIDTKGFGVGANLTWADAAGGYVDAQAQANWFDSDLSSNMLGKRAGGANGDGYAVSVEAGKAIGAPSFTLTPQAQLSYAKVGFDRFVDEFGAVVSDDGSDSLRARLGLALDHAWTTQGGEGGLYGLVNVSHEFLDGTRIDVSGAPLLAKVRSTWAGLTAGGSYAWGQGRFMVYGEAAADTSLSGFGDSYDLTGSVGFRVRF